MSTVRTRSTVLASHQVQLVTRPTLILRNFAGIVQSTT